MGSIVRRLIKSQSLLIQGRFQLDKYGRKLGRFRAYLVAIPFDPGQVSTFLMILMVVLNLIFFVAIPFDPGQVSTVMFGGRGMRKRRKCRNPF